MPLSTMYDINVGCKRSAAASSVKNIVESKNEIQWRFIYSNISFMLCVRPAFPGIAGGIVRRKLFKQLQKLLLLGFVKVAHQLMAHLVPLGIGFLRGDAAFFRKRYVYGAAVLIVGGALYKPRRLKLCKHLACGAGLNVQPLGKGGLGYYIAAFQQHRERCAFRVQ